MSRWEGQVIILESTTFDPCLQVSEIIVGTGKFIRRESMMGALMIYPWLRHLPMFNSQFSKSKSVGPMKMRQLQDDVVAEKQVIFHSN